jgi:hypothetical protein
VVSVVGKGGGVLRQVALKETNVSEPLMTRRKTQDDVETGVNLAPGSKVGKGLLIAQPASGVKAA